MVRQLKSVYVQFQCELFSTIFVLGLVESMNKEPWVQRAKLYLRRPMNRSLTDRPRQAGDTEAICK